MKKGPLVERPFALSDEFYFTPDIDGGWGDEMLVTSIAPVAAQAVAARRRRLRG